MAKVLQVDDRTRKVESKKPKGALPTVMESLPPVLAISLEWVMRIAAVVFLATLAYDIYGVGMGIVAHLWQHQLHDQWHIIHNLRIAGSVLAISGGYLAFYAFLAWYEHGDWFLLLAGIFGLFNFGAPFLFYNQMSYDSRNAAMWEILHYWRIAGDACLVVTATRLLCAIVSVMRHGLPATAARAGLKLRLSAGHDRQRKKPAHRIWKRCWETPYCQDFLLAVCPAWQRKKTCWKYGSGCMCDPSMMERLIQVELAPGMGGSRAQSSFGAAPAGPKKCHTCPIYLEHEEEKFSLLSPLVVVVSLAMLVVWWDWVTQEYEVFASWIGHVIAQVALGPTQYLANEWTTTFLDPVVEYGLLILGALALISYGLKVVEWAVLEKKL